MKLNQSPSNKCGYDGDESIRPTSTCLSLSQRKSLFLVPLALFAIVALNLSAKQGGLGVRIGQKPKSVVSDYHVPNGVNSDALLIYDHGPSNTRYLQFEDTFPGPLDGFKNVWDTNREEHVTPVFWHIPKAGGSSFKSIFGNCHRLTVAAEMGLRPGEDEDSELEAFHFRDNKWHKYVNVDTAHVEGLQRAKRKGLVPSGIADLIVLGHIYEGNSLFDSHHQGQLIAVFRHPVDRQMSLFNYLKYATWERTYEEKYASMTVHDYVRDRHAADNWLTRFLSNHFDGIVTDEHLEIAKRVVREKILVGLLSEKEITMNRFEFFFGWKYKTAIHVPGQQERCRNDFLGNGAANVNHNNKKLGPGDTDYEAIASLLRYDLKLYEFIEDVFWEQQKTLFTNMPDDYRLPSQNELQEQVQHAYSYPAPLDGYRHIEGRSEGIMTPVFWNIPNYEKGGDFKNFFGRCHRLTVAADVGNLMGHEKDKELDTFYLESNLEQKFVNVDTTKIAGLERANEMNLVPSGLADVIMVDSIFDANILFDSSHKGQLFAVFQDPVDREISKFMHLQTSIPDFSEMTVQEYARSPYVKDNWLTRFLSNDFINELTVSHNRIARRILRGKVLVGLESEKEITMNRFERFFGWKYHINPADQEQCRIQFLSTTGDTDSFYFKHGIGGIDYGHDYEAIAALNIQDMALFHYIQTLFWSQEHLLTDDDVSSGYRWEGATCCQCDDPPTC